MLGYTLNGFYVVEEQNPAQKATANRSKKMEVVYCQFHQPRHRDTKLGESYTI